MIGMAKITSKGQVTMPKKVREYLNLNKGDTLIFELKNGALQVRKSQSIENYFATLPPLKISFKDNLPGTIAKDVMKKK